MKNMIILILTFLLFLVFGQNNSSDQYTVEDHLHSEVLSVKNTVDKTNDDIESKIKTTLINDIKEEKSVLNFDLKKSYNLSFGEQVSKKYNQSNQQVLDGVLFETDKSKDFKKKFKEAINLIKLKNDTRI